MHRRMKAVHVEYSLCCSSVVEWCKRFLEGRGLLKEDARLGQVLRVIKPEMNALVLDSRRITVDEIHRLLGISVGTTYTIMHNT
ncbi:uncharacterized protein TNCV_3204881 [Trichonephila clavipes]|nr:uncharacterized protein TNCV_3204881 [Trichonephila clavipes]